VADPHRGSPRSEVRQDCGQAAAHLPDRLTPRQRQLGVRPVVKLGSRPGVLVAATLQFPEVLLAEAGVQLGDEPDPSPTIWAVSTARTRSLVTRRAAGRPSRARSAAIARRPGRACGPTREPSSARSRGAR
jgi:hypothetical protein